MLSNSEFIVMLNQSATDGEELAKLLNISELQSILHDIGKFCNDFEDYINGNSRFKRGDIDHSFAGARYIIELADEMDSLKEND